MINAKSYPFFFSTKMLLSVTACSHHALLTYSLHNTLESVKQVHLAVQMPSIPNKRRILIGKEFARMEFQTPRTNISCSN